MRCALILLLCTALDLFGADPAQLAPQPPERPPWLTRRLRLRVSRVGDHGGVVVSNRLGHARRELAFLPSRRKLAHPDRRLAACLDNLIRQPLELLAITRIERKRSQTIEHLRCP